MEPCQPPPAQDSALEAVELQLQLEQGFLGGKILSAALMSLMSLMPFGRSVCPSTPGRGVIMSQRGQTHARGGGGRLRTPWGPSAEPRKVQIGAGVGQHSPLTVPSLCTEDFLTQVLTHC